MNHIKGGRNNIEKVYQVYYMDVYSFIITIVKNAQLAEELTQETFYRAMKSTFRGDSKELTWLCAIAKNLCMDVLRKKKTEEYKEEEAESNINVEQMVVDKEAAFAVHMALHQLEEPYKEVFSLRIFGELSFREIGQIFGKTENWARVTYHRAKLMLQDVLGKDK